MQPLFPLMMVRAFEPKAMLAVLPVAAIHIDSNLLEPVNQPENL